MGRLSRLDKRQKRMLMVGLLLVAFVISSPMLFSGTGALSGYQSITAEWYKVDWKYADGTPYTYYFEEDRNSVSWDASDAQPYGWNKNTYAAEVEQPKFYENINYHDWWINETVSASNPTGIAKHYEWSIDIYRVNVNFRVSEGIEGAYGAEFWLEFENNVNSVFKMLGAEEAVSYIIYAQTEVYTKVPELHPHAIITPSVSNFYMEFLDGRTAVPPGVPQSGSNLNFDNLEPFSHIAIQFILEDFAGLLWQTQPVVNMLLELNVLTIGRFDYALTYVEAGDDDIVPIGELGIFDSIAAALAAGLSALGDFAGGFTDLILMIVVIFGLVLITIVIVKTVITGVLQRGIKRITKRRKHR